MSPLPRRVALLLEAKRISADQMAIAAAQAAGSRQSLESALLALGFVTEADVCAVVAAAEGLEPVSLEECLPDPQALACIPKGLAQKLCVLPLALQGDGQGLVVAMPDIDDVMVLDELRAALPPGMDLLPKIATATSIRRVLDQAYGFSLSIDALLQEAMDAPAHVIAGGGDVSPVAKLVDALLVDSMRHRASDLHLEPGPGFVRIRYRVDGVMRPVRMLHARFWSPLCVRLKVLAGLDIAESRCPQDGRIAFRHKGLEAEFRVSTLPTIDGENIVLRVLEKGSLAHLCLDALGLDDAEKMRVQELLRVPDGITLVAGPTGSGKTTLMYALLDAMNSEHRNIMTLEDPVEYALPLLRQVAVNQLPQVSFADGVRAILRQDPDVLLIGEIRDAETAHMAFRAAITGHRVFATVHARSAVDVIPRLQDLGVRPLMLSGTINAILSLRLLRRVSPACVERRLASPEAKRQLGVAADAACELAFVAERFCDTPHQGYSGRKLVLECLRVDDQIDTLIHRGAPPAEILAYAQKSGHRTLADAAREQVLRGVTTLDEAARVVGFFAGYRG